MKKVILAATAMATIAVFGAACSGSKSSGPKKLESGEYQYDVATISPDTCFDASTEALLKTQGLLKFMLTTSNATADGPFTLVPPSVAADIVPPIVGTRTGDALTAAGNLTYDVDSSCSLAISANATGALTADDEFDADIALSISAATTASNGLASNCAHLAGTTIGGVVPFPTLTPTSNGSCALTLSGHAFNTAN